jgi:septal ring-binding cell division protein DamX
MTDEEIAKLAEEFVADETTAPVETEHADPHHEAVAETDTKPKTPADPHHAEKPAPAAKHTEEPSSAAKNIAAGKTPTAVEPAVKKTVTPEERIPSSLPKDVAQYAVGKFTVQVASYADEAEAQKIASDLKNKGYSAFYIPANIKGKTWFRVSVGQFATQKEAQSYRSEFMSTSKMTSAIVQKITE